MKKFLITIDSSCDVSIDFCIKNNIIPLLMKYTIDDEIFQDTMKEEDINEFYNKMRRGSVPKTTQINVSDYLDFWRSLLKEKLPIIHLSLSSGLSGTYNNSQLAINILGDENKNCNIHVINTYMASGGILLTLMKLIDYRDKGLEYSDSYQIIEKNIKNVNTFFTTSEMIYLYRGGRVSRITAVVAGLLKMNPILKVDDNGKLVVHQTVPGEKRAFKRVVELIDKCMDKKENNKIIISHSDCFEKAEKFGGYLKEKYNIEIIYTKIGSTIGAHTGPGLVAIFFYGENR